MPHEPHAPTPPNSGLRCPSCAITVADDSRFCHECGVPLVALAGEGSPAPGGERRPITILFVDALSATSDLGSLDPEELHQLVERLLGVLEEGVRLFDGTIDRFTGHGIKALFGAPVAMENHAQLACQAALHLDRALRDLAEELRRTVGIGLSTRMGLHSAEAVLGAIGHGPGGSDFLTQGHTAALASRIEQVARPGEIWVSDSTARLVSDYYQLRDLGHFALRGLEKSQRLFALEGTGDHASRFEAQRARGFSTFVGRLDELERLEAAYDRAQTAGPVRISLTGEAGVGKTRLCEEFARRSRERGIAVYQVRGLESERWLPFSATTAFLRGQLGISTEELASTARARIATQLVQAEPELERSLPELFRLLGIAENDEPTRRDDPQATIELIGRVILSLFASRRRVLPTIFLIDDCRWLDAGTANLAELFFRWNRPGPFLVVASDRGEIEASWQGTTPFERIDLKPLDGDASRQLIQSRLGTDPGLAPLVERIDARGGGNPLFLEELISSLVAADALKGESGSYRAGNPVLEEQLPETLHAGLSARLDALPEPDRTLVRTAAVIDREFEEELLRDLLDCSPADVVAALGRLVTTGFLDRVPRGGERAYAFRHPLLREAAYRFLLDEPRRRLHGAVAAALVRRYPEALDDYAALIAHHHETAGDDLLAVRWHCRAAAFLGFRIPTDAREHCRRALERIEALPDTDEVAVLAMGACLRTLQLGSHLGTDLDEATQCFETGRRHAKRLRDNRTLALLVEVYGAIRSLYGPADEAVSHTHEASRIARETNDPGIQLALRSRLALAMFRAGDLHGAAQLVDASPDIRPDDDGGMDLLGFSAGLHLRVMRVGVHTEMSRLEGLPEELEDIVEAAEARDEHSILAWAWTSFAPLARARGTGAADAARAAHRAIALAASGGNRMTRTPPLLALGLALYEDERSTEAREVLKRALASIRTGGPTALLEAGILAALSRTVTACGDPIQAERLAREALELSRSRGARLYELDARLARAHALLAGRQASRADEIARELALIEQLIGVTGVRRAAPDLHRSRARLARLRGDQDTYERELEHTRALCVELGAPARADRLLSAPD